MSGEAHPVKRHLRVDAEGYDVENRRFIPHYDEMIATGVEVLAALALRGSSGFSGRELSGSAAGGGRDCRFAGPSPRPRYGDQDGAVQVYRSIHEALSPGGVLLNIDAAVTKGARLNVLVFDQMAQRMGDHGISAC
jgi:hypothetical protein